MFTILWSLVMENKLKKIYINESVCCTPETNTILLFNYISIKKSLHLSACRHFIFSWYLVSFSAIIWGKVEIQIHHFFFFCPHSVACGTSVSQPGIEPGPWQWKHQMLAIRAPENFLISILNCFFLSFLFQSQDHTEIFVLLEATKNIFCSSYSYYILYFA